MSVSEPYVYKMVQVPTGFKADRKNGSEAANFLQSLANQMSAKGWEFYRVDSFTIAEEPGCLGALLGHKQQLRATYVVTFRRPSKKMV